MAEMQYKTRNVSSNVLTEITPTSTLSDLSAPHQPIVPYFFVSLPLNHPKKTMHIRLVKSDKKRFLDLLLLADEQESMIDRYIERGDLFVMEEKGEAKAVAVVTREGQGIKPCRSSRLPTQRLRTYDGGARMALLRRLPYPVGRHGRQPANPAVLPQLRIYIFTHLARFLHPTL